MTSLPAHLVLDDRPNRYRTNDVNSEESNIMDIFFVQSDRKFIGSSNDG